MRPETQLSLRAEQRLLLLPRMLQSIEVLQLASHELATRIEAELSRNETLTVSEPRTEPPAPNAGATEEPVFDRAEWARPRAAASGSDGSWLDGIESPPTGLIEHLRVQLAFAGFDAQLVDAVLGLACFLDQRGYLAASDDELASQVERSLLPAALATLRSLEPRGLGARNAIDALLLQIDAVDPDRADLEALLTRHLEALARNRIPEVALALGRSVDEVQSLIARVRRLDPRPGARFFAEHAPGLTPDVTARLVAGELEVRVDDQDLPALGIDPQYAELAAAAGVERDVRTYLREKLESARALIGAVEQRRRTLARVAASVLSRQRGFLELGPTKIAPLRMAEIAAALGLHVSTVSRAVAGKLVQTDFGIYRLRDFFDGGEISTQVGASGSHTGRFGVKEQVRQLVTAEEPGRPRSDDDLVALLRARGISVARRTVTKYRKELGIPSSWMRRKHGEER